MEDDANIAPGFAERLHSAVGATPQAVVAKRAGISVGAMNKYLNGSEPGGFKAARLAKALGVDLGWLLTGAGSPNAAAGGYVSVPIFDVRLAAGVGAFHEVAEQIGEMPIDRGLLRDLGCSSTDGLAAFVAEGDSMEPKISNGARVIADLKDTRLREGVFAFRTGDELRIKRLRRMVDGIQIISDNDIYAPELVTGDAADELTIIGRVLCTVNLL